jgi:hypothetical protein
MYEIPLDDIHRLLEMLEAVIPAIERRPTDSIQVAMVPALSEVVLEVLDWSNTAYIENKLGVNPSLLSKFVKMRGVVRKKDALKIADRLRTYLKSEDQGGGDIKAGIPPTSNKKAPLVAKPKPFIFSGEQWVEIALSSEVKAKIAVIASLLDSIIEQVSRANAPEDEQILTKMERQQLIAVLETALNILKSPMVEKGLLRKAKDVLTKGAESAVEKSVQHGVGLLMEGAAARIVDFIRTLGG